jgi:hypothetical protein
LKTLLILEHVKQRVWFTQILKNTIFVTENDKRREREEAKERARRWSR